MKSRCRYLSLNIIKNSYLKFIYQWVCKRISEMRFESLSFFLFSLNWAVGAVVERLLRCEILSGESTKNNNFEASLRFYGSWFLSNIEGDFLRLLQ